MTADCTQEGRLSPRICLTVAEHMRGVLVPHMMERKQGKQRRRGRRNQPMEQREERPSLLLSTEEARLLAIDSCPQQNRLYRESPRRSGYGSLGLGVLYSYVFVQDLLSCLSGYEVLYLTAEGYECNRSGDEDRRESTEYYTENHREREAAYAVTTEDEDAQEHEER